MKKVGLFPYDLCLISSLKLNICFIFIKKKKQQKDQCKEEVKEQHPPRDATQKKTQEDYIYIYSNFTNIWS